MRKLILACPLVAAATLSAWAYPDKDTMEYYNTFELDAPRDWELVGNAQFTLSIAFGSHPGPSAAHRGRHFVRLAAAAAGEWASVNHWQNVRAGDACVFAVWVKTSPELTAGYISVRRDGGNGRQGAIVAERALTGPRPAGDPKDNGYQLVELDFPTNASTRLLFYVGMYGNGKGSWIEADDVTILCDPLGPAEGVSQSPSDPNGLNRRRPGNF